MNRIVERRADASKAIEAVERERFVNAARAYIGTPYHPHGMVKGAGVDCGTLILCAGKDAGLVDPKYALGYYSPQWHLHREEEKYLHILRALDLKEVPFPALMGDIVVWRFGRTFSHGAIVIDWPRIIHACMGCVVSEDDAEKSQWLRFMGEENGKPRPMKLFSRWDRDGIPS